MPKISVVIPNYNHQKFLEKRITSVLNQTLDDIEIIILDDASTDNSLEVINKFSGDPRVRIIANETNGGSVFRQWNKGMREATGEYVWIAESDDYSDENFLRVVSAKLDQYPSAGVAYCQSWMIDENDEIISLLEDNNKYLHPSRWTADYLNNGMQEIEDYILNACTINNVSSAVIRKSVVEKINYAQEDWRIVGDWSFWIRMLEVSDIAFCAQPLNYWRCHSNTVRSATLKNGKMIYEGYKLLADFLQSPWYKGGSIEKILRNRFNQWICYSEDYRLSISANKEIYSMARLCDPSLNKRILNYIPLLPARFVSRRIWRWIKTLRKNR